MKLFVFTVSLLLSFEPFKFVFSFGIPLLPEMEWKEVALMSAKTQVEVRGFVAQVSASLTYHNYYSEPLQVSLKTK